MAEKRISPKAPDKTQASTSKTAAARVSKKKTAKKQMHLKKASR